MSKYPNQSIFYRFITHPVSIVFLITCSVFILYGNTLNAKFVYDDLGQIQENTRIRSLSYIPSLFTKSVWSFLELDDEGKGLNNYYRPVQFMVYALVFHFAQLDPGAYHWVSVVLHLVNVFLVFLVANKLLEDRLWALVTSLLFSMHPVQTEVVAWVACQPEQLYAMCYLVGMLLFFIYHVCVSRLYKSLFFLSILITYYFGLFCKEAMVTFPAVVLVMDITKYPGQKRRSLAWRYLFFLATFLLYLPWRYTALGGFAPVQRYSILSWFNVVLTIPDLLRQYVQKMVYPLPLSAYHKFFPVLSIGDPRFWLGMLILFIVTGMLYMFLQKKNCLPVIAIAWFYIALGPMLYIRSIGENVFCERYLYLPSIGFILLFVYGLEKMVIRVNSAMMFFVVITFLGLLLTGMGITVVDRNHDWYDKGTFMESLGRSMETTPGFLCHDKAVYLIEKANSIPDPEQRVKLFKEALARFQECEKLYGATPNLHFNRGVVYMELGDLDKAETELNKGYTGKKSDAGVYVMLGRLELKRNNPGKAKEYFFKALEIDEHFPHAFAALARLALMNKNYDKALEYFFKLEKEIPGQANIYAEIASIYLIKGDLDNAEKYCKKTIDLDPRFIAAYGNLGTIYTKRGNFLEAEKMYKKVLSIDPANAKAKMLLEKLKQLN